MIADIIDELKYAPFWREKTYLPDELGDEPIVLRPKVGVKLIAWFLNTLAISIISYLVSSLFFDHMAALQCSFFVAFFSFCFFLALLLKLKRITKKITITKDQVIFSDKSDKYFSWSEIYKIYYYSWTYLSVSQYGYFYAFEGAKIALKNKKEHDESFSFNFYDSPAYIVEMLEKYSCLYDLGVKKYESRDIDEVLRQKNEEAQIWLAVYVLVCIC